ncbi:hypothetical protein DYB35_009327 [Aphanomyces astaci]|uniref:Uncharacterized protein n=1 Tax=Aphanomyces astaci TaxID=112090 RepID=A0A418CTH3_APHAT|nr:hypothetical protein DYB35_009327 [Aphanomyces astaci]
MGYICVVPQFVENSKKLTSNEVLSDKATFDTITKTENYLPCFHDPAFVQQQLYVSFIIWASFLFFSILWVVASNQQNRSLKNDEVGFSLALRQWARKDRIAIIINRPVQLVASLGIFVILVNRCNYLSVDVAEYYIGLALYLAAFVDTLVRFCAAKQKISYAFSPYTILDIFSLASYFCVGFAPSLLINGTAARTWLDFSIMRSIFIYRSFMEMDSHFDTSTRGIMLFRLAVRCFLLLMWAASVMFFVEMTGEINAFVDNGFAHLYSCPNGTPIAVVLGDSSSKYVKGLIQRLESEPKFASTVTYDFPCWAIALRNDNIRHMLAAGVDRDGIMCEETMKMGVMARSCACPGYATFLSNLASCLSLAKQPDSPFALRSKAALGGDLNAAPCVAAAAAQPWMDHYYAGASRDESDAMAARIHGVRVMLNPGHAMRLKEGSSVYVIADDLASVQAFHITNDDVADDEDDVVHSPRPSTGRQSTLRTPLLPSSSSTLPSTHPAKAPVPPPRRFRTLLSGESMHLDSTLDRVVSSIRMPTRRPDQTVDPRRASLMDVFSSGSPVHEQPRELTPPPMSVLEDPRHIVVCSFLGDESLAALQWFISPLRGVYSLNMPPITILDASPPSGDWVSAIAKFSDVVQLQRAGAKSAHSVLVLAKKSKAASTDGGAGPMQTSLMDADAIFTTLLVDLKMNPSRMFTLTELTDESNSKLLNKRFLVQQPGAPHNDGSTDKLHSMWDIALSASAGVHNGSTSSSSAPSIYSMPLYMSGRLMHPQFCENLLVQNGNVEYGLLFHAYAGRHFPGILLGVYRKPTPATDASAASSILPVVLTCPATSLTMADGDVLYVLYGWNVLEDAAKAIQVAFRAWKGVRPWLSHPPPSLMRRRTTKL